MRDYFNQQELQFEYCPYGDTLRVEFMHASRDEYFQGIEDDTLQSAVILVDPDNGLEVKTSRPGIPPQVPFP